jgi:hypothetical protein
MFVYKGIVRNHPNARFHVCNTQKLRFLFFFLKDEGFCKCKPCTLVFKNQKLTHDPLKNQTKEPLLFQIFMLLWINHLICKCLDFGRVRWCCYRSEYLHY